MLQRLTVLIVVMLFGTSLFAGSMSAINGQYDDADLQTTVNEQLTEIAVDLNKEASIKLTGNQNDLATGCASSNSGLITAGTLYSGLDSPLVSVGFGVLTLSSVSPWNAMGLRDDANDGKDTSTGLAVNAFVLTPTVNGDQFMPVKGFLFEAKFGMHSMDKAYNYELKSKSLVAGAGFRYKVLAMPAGSPMWAPRTLTVGTGVYYTSSRLQYNTKDSPLEFSRTSTDSSTGTDINTVTTSKTTLDFDINSSAIVVPIEVVTSAKALHGVNLIGGTGFDLIFGSTEITVDQSTDITVVKDGSRVDPKAGGEPGFKLSNSTTKADADIFRAKLIFGLGFQVGQAKLEFPLAYYPIDGGFSTSAVVGAEF